MTTGAAITLVVILVSMDLIVVGAIAQMSRAMWSTLAAAFPARAPAADAVVRRFQSIKLNLFNFGGCIHIAADATHLHLTPARLARWFGAQAVSIPWEQVKVIKPGRKHIKTTVGALTLTGPTWALQLAEGPAT